MAITGRIVRLKEKQNVTAILETRKGNVFLEIHPAFPMQLEIGDILDIHDCISDKGLHGYFYVLNDKSIVSINGSLRL